MTEEEFEPGYVSLFFEYDFSWQDVSQDPDYYEISIQQFDGELLSENFDDVGDNNDLIREQIQTYSGSVGEMAQPFHVYLLHTSEEYHLYTKSIANVTYGDPFSEPTQIYSNVTNGLGCFGSYTGSSVYLNP